MKNRIAQLRKERRITQEELADAVEVTRQTIISLENGRYNASLLLAHKIAKYFGSSIEEIFSVRGGRDMKKLKPILLAAAALGGLALMAAAALLDLPGGITGLMCGMGGALLGLGGSSVIMGAVERHMSPQERKELQRSETDERNIAIREKAAQSSWYWTLYLLWVPFVISLVRGETLWILLSSAVTVLHCVFYMVNMGRWAKKL